MFVTATSILVFRQFLGCDVARSNAFIVISMFNFSKFLVKSTKVSVVYLHIHIYVGHQQD